MDRCDMPVRTRFLCLALFVGSLGLVVVPLGGPAAAEDLRGAPRTDRPVLVAQAERPSRVSAGAGSDDTPRSESADAGGDKIPDGDGDAAAPSGRIVLVSAEQLAALKERIAAEPDEAERLDLSAELAKAANDLAITEETMPAAQASFLELTSKLPDAIAKLTKDIEQAKAPVSADELDTELESVSSEISTEVARREETQGGIGGWTQEDEANLEVLEARQEELLTQLETRLATAKEAIGQAEQRLQAGKTRFERDTARLAEVDALLKQRPVEIANISQALTSVQSPEDLAAELRVVASKAKLQRLEAEVPALEAERRYLREYRQQGVPELEAESLKLTVLRQREVVAALEPTVTRTREAIRRVEIRKAESAIALVPEALRPAAESNRQLTEELAAAEREIDAILAENEFQQEIERKWLPRLEKLKRPELDRQFSGIRNLELRSQLAELPSISAIRVSANARRETYEKAEIDLYEMQRSLDKAIATGEPLDLLLDGRAVTDEQRKILRGEAETIMADRVDVLGQLVATLKRLKSAALQAAETEFVLADDLAEIREKLTGQLLWTRSHPNMLDVRQEGTAWTASDRTRVFLRSDVYVRLATRILEDMAKQPILYVMTAIFGVILLIIRQWMRFRIRRLAERATSRANTSVRPVIRALAMTAADAAVWPGLIAFAAARLGAAFADDPEVVSIAGRLLRLAVALFLAALIHDGCLPGGAAEILGLPANVAAYIRRKIFRLEVVGGPLAAIALVLHSEDLTLAMQPVARLAFIAALVCLGRFINQMLRRNSPITAMLTDAATPPAYLKLRPILWAISLGAIICLGVLSIIGYHNTAIELLLKVEATIWLALGLLVTRLLFATVIALRRRRIRYDAIRRRVEEAKNQSVDEPPAAEASTSDQVSALAASIPLENEDDDESVVERLTDQSQRLISTIAAVAFLVGTYMIWSSVIPALAERQIYPFEELALDDTETKVITLGNIFAGIAAIAITITAARNLPGLLEFSVLERIGLDRSVRYAITTILSYVIFLVGILVTGKLFGFDWDNVQWLAAGLTVGLGFGLQEIFANFVSGLIIFFEQPIRVGDIVTIDDVTGVVSRIRIRATTIVNWDRKEYIVPNREFITGRLLNWTLSDTTNRLVLHVGIAYGSDSERARTVLLDILNNHSAILSDPGPLVTLEELGDSSLNFTIRCYLPTLDNRLSTTHELYTEIHRRFGAEGIEIPFPQRDLNVRGLPLGVEVSHASDASE